jgi:transposase-like protein
MSLAAAKLLDLAMRNFTPGRVRSMREWRGAMNEFAVMLGDRFIDPKN